MRYYFAPMEGITDSVYRSLHHKYFPGIHQYYTPFFSPTIHRSLTKKEQRELPMADSICYTVIPQILTKIPADFQWIAQMCAEAGYQEVNLNLGCPSGTVTAKGKGSGMLTDPEALNSFLDRIFAASPLPVSVKTRLGFRDPEEFPRLLEVFNQYPIKELTIHPRVRAQFYNGAVDLNAFSYAAQKAKVPLCFNGNLNSTEDISAISLKFPNVNAVMLGRGLIADPGMLSSEGTTAEKLEQFTAELLEEYTRTFESERNAMFRMKENWRYLLCKFENSEKLGKQLRKTTDISQFKEITHRIIHELPIRQQLMPDW